MTIPTQPVLNNAEALVIAGASLQDDKFNTNRKYIEQDFATSGDPNVFTRLTEAMHNANMMLAPAAQGLVILSSAGGLNVAVFPLRYEIGGTAKSFTGSNSFAMTDDVTNYVYLDGDETLKKTTGSFPANVFHLAVVVAASGSIAQSGVSDRRFENHGVGAGNAWSTIAATEDVDFDGYNLNDVGGIDLTNSSELTIASGVIAPTQMLHSVDTESDDATDQLDTITAVAGERQLLILQPETITRVVTILGITADNIKLAGAVDMVFDSNASLLVLLQTGDDEWREVARSPSQIGVLGNDLNAAGFDITSLGVLDFSVSTSSISSGAISAASRSSIEVDTEASASTDDLDTITGGSDGQWLMVRPANTARTVIVKHAVGANKFLLANDLDFSMTTTEHAIFLQHNGTQWIETSRSPMDVADLAGTSASIPYPIDIPWGALVGGEALSAKVGPWEKYVPRAFTIVNAIGRVTTAPSGGTLIVDVQVDGVSIFSNEGQMINITSGNFQDVSATKNHAVGAGSRIGLECKSSGGSPHSADDLIVTINGLISAQTPP